MRRAPLLFFCLLGACSGKPWASGQTADCDPATPAATPDDDCGAQQGLDTRAMCDGREVYWSVAPDGSCTTTLDPAPYTCDPATNAWNCPVHGMVPVCERIPGLDPTTGSPTADACAALAARCETPCASGACCTFVGADYQSAVPR